MPIKAWPIKAWFIKISGYPLKLAQRVQFNMFIRPLEGVASMENVSKSLVPVIWVEESTVLGDEYTDLLKNKLFRSLKIVNIIKWVVIGIGVTALIVSFFLFVYIMSP
ncbi:hypothetical protein NQ318_021986 [Aromia moschata]|uniref:Sensory neuron membrane protein 2 n=1 Tax=Aromia moschata TaxID=1265417 RepID=A0AAV8Z512_9CUCU|nr:hypothetical protein NQ318_021986 [Aromia moschata]